MNDLREPSSADAERAVERELWLVETAIAAVAAGTTPRVELAGLHFAEALIEPSRELARAAGVRVVALWHPDDAGADLAIEPVDEDPGSASEGDDA